MSRHCGAGWACSRHRSRCRADWKTYVDVLNLQRHYPGIQGIGYSLWLEPDDLPGHIAGIRAEGFPDHDIRPAPPREEYTAIIYLEPFDERNRQAFGYDIWSEEVRHKAMRRRSSWSRAARKPRCRPAPSRRAVSTTSARTT